jgi:signal peptidase I
MQRSPSGIESFDPQQPPSMGHVTASAPSDASFLDHAGLDIDDPWRPPAPPRSLGSRWPRRLSQVSETLEVIALEIMMFMGVRAVGQNFIVGGRSMEATFLNAELLIMNRVAYLGVDLSWAPGVETEHSRPFGEPQQGDVVVFIYPGDPAHERDFIKRMIAVPWQAVEIRDETAIVAGVSLLEPYLGQKWEGSLAVPAGQLFVMGDNRDNSLDLRAWGMLDQQLLIGRVDLRYWPFDRMGLVDHDLPDSAATAGLSAAP